MGSTSRHLSITIDRPTAEVYDFASDPHNLPQWAAGLAGTMVHRDGDHWATESSLGKIRFTFTEPNDLGVLDHDVTLPSGEVVYNPVRVIDHGDGCEVVFTLRQRDGVSDAELEADAAAVTRDLETLKAVVEAR